MTTVRAKRIALALAAAAVLTLVALAFFRDWSSERIGQLSVTPTVMGTTTKLAAVGPREKLQPAIDAALVEIRAVEKSMSRHDPATPLSRFNQAAPDADIMLDEHTLTVMRFGQVLAERTGGAFDVTMLPLGDLWRSAGQAGRLPTDAELAEARQRVGHEKLEVGRESARKTAPGMAVSLDAIAKGYAVDRAVEAMKKAGAAGGLVELGGDLRTFGRSGNGEPILVRMQDPFGEGVVMTLQPLPGEDLAVCTSGNYRRFVEIAGKRYSHIIDPRTGTPADAVPSVTVIAPDTMAADGWATALSVLSIADGRKLIEAEPGVEAMWITGTPDAPRFHYSAGFEKYIRK